MGIDWKPKAFEATAGDTVLSVKFNGQEWEWCVQEKSADGKWADGSEKTLEMARNCAVLECSRMATARVAKAEEKARAARDAASAIERAMGSD